MFQVAVEQPNVQPETVFTLFESFAVTNAMLTNLLVLGIFIVLAIAISRRKSVVPTGFHVLIETTVESFVNLLQQITGKRETALQLLGLVGAIFLYMGVSNLLLLIPGLSSFTYNGVSLFRTPTNDFNTTFSIAFAVIIITNIMSIKVFGVFGHLGKFFKFKEVYAGFKSSIGDGFLAIIDFLIGLLDIISEIAKVVSLSLRLFGNMYAGEVLAAILLGSFAILVPAPWLAMNLLVGILQALVFGALTAAYYTLAVEVAEAEAT
jgi:F-type H+-transporting ATPase subunit a